MTKIEGIKRTAVTDVTVAEIGYDEPTRTMEVLGKDGNVTQYQDGPTAKHYAKILESGDIGGHVAAINGNVNQFPRLQIT